MDLKNLYKNILKNNYNTFNAFINYNIKNTSPIFNVIKTLKNNIEAITYLKMKLSNSICLFRTDFTLINKVH